MRNLFQLFVLLVFFTACKNEIKTDLTEKVKDTYVQDNYTKNEFDIVMRDGIKLHTTVYSPKDTSQKYPLLMMRTPYSCKPYGEGQFKSKIGPNDI